MKSREDTLTRFQASENFVRRLSGFSPIIWRSFFPRSICGKYQDDPIVGAILRAAPDKQLSKLSRVDVIELVSKIMTPAKPRTLATLQCLVGDYFDSYENSRPSEFVGLIADRLKFLETYNPTPGDFAIEELQNASAGFWHWPPIPGSRRITPGPNWPPTKGIVVAIAKERLRKHKRKADFSKSSWSQFLKEADLDNELIEGKPGRPRQSLDENLKAARECKAILAKTVHESGGDWVSYKNKMLLASGTKAGYKRSEEDRLRNFRPGSNEELE
jgi:hypothetical protein